METENVAPQWACLCCGPEQQEHLGMWLGHHLGSRGPGGTALMTFNNLPVCHLGSGNNTEENQPGICVEILFTGPLYLWRRLFVPAGMKYREWRTFHNIISLDILKLPLSVLPVHVKTIRGILDYTVPVYYIFWWRVNFWTPNLTFLSNSPIINNPIKII